MKIDAVEFLKQLSDPTRLRALLLLHRHGELCVCELTHALELSQPKVSRHLANLRRIGIVNSRREGLWMHYSLNPDLPDWSREIIVSVQRGVHGDRPYADDEQSLASMPDRPGTTCCA